MTWAAEQAEAWMREHPGRWLEDSEGDMWRWAYGEWWCTIAADCLEESPPPSAYAGPLTFHPPREHWAAEVKRIADNVEDAHGYGLPQWRNVEALRALFRAAPEEP